MAEFKQKAPKETFLFGSLACGTFWKFFFIPSSRRLGLDSGTLDIGKDNDDAQSIKIRESDQ